MRKIPVENSELLSLLKSGFSIVQIGKRYSQSKQWVHQRLKTNAEYQAIITERRNAKQLNRKTCPKCAEIGKDSNLWSKGRGYYRCPVCGYTERADGNSKS